MFAMQCALTIVALYASHRYLNSTECYVCNTFLWVERRMFICQIFAATVSTAAVHDCTDAIFMLTVTLCIFTCLLLRESLWPFVTWAECSMCTACMCSTCALNTIKHGTSPVRCACGRTDFGCLRSIAPPCTVRALKDAAAMRLQTTD